MRRLPASARVLGAQSLVLTMCGTPRPRPSHGRRKHPPRSRHPRGTSKPPSRWLALGDSFSSGEGTFTWPGLLKDRTQHKERSYPPRALKIFAANGQNGRKSTLDFRACTGADAVGTGSEDLPAQLARVGDEKYGLVTLTIGGNDAKFTESVGLLPDDGAARDRRVHAVQQDQQGTP